MDSFANEGNTRAIVIPFDVVETIHGDRRSKLTRPLSDDAIVYEFPDARLDSGNGSSTE